MCVCDCAINPKSDRFVGLVPGMAAIGVASTKNGDWPPWNAVGDAMNAIFKGVLPGDVLKLLDVMSRTAGRFLSNGR